MKIKGNRIKEGKPLERGKLYTVRRNREIIFEEKETIDRVNIDFSLEEGQYGIYGNEFKPDFVNDEGTKKADILVLVIDENKKKFGSWVFDVKQTVGGEDVIYHLIGQLRESVIHKNSITLHLQGYSEEQHIGYITRDLQKERIAMTIQKKESYIEEEEFKIKSLPLLIGMAAGTKLLKEKSKLKTLKQFADEKIEIESCIYPLECCLYEKDADCFDLKVCC